MSFEEFQDGCHLGYQNGTILAILNLYVALMLPSIFVSILIMVWEMSFEEFQDGNRDSHLGYWKGMI